MNDEYIRKDLYEADKDTWYLLVENLEKRLEDVKTFTGWGFAILAIVFGLIQIALAIFMFYLSTK